VVLSPQRYIEKEMGPRCEQRALAMKESPHSNTRAELPSMCTEAVSRKTMSDTAEPLEEMSEQNRNSNHRPSIARDEMQQWQHDGLANRHRGDM
jgi:hypothetical protein